MPLAACVPMHDHTPAVSGELLGNVANQDIGNGKISAAVNDEMMLIFTCRHGALVAVHSELARAGSGASKLEQRDWNELDFQKHSPREWKLTAASLPGKYLITIVPLLLGQKTELKVDLVKSGTLVYRRTSSGRTGVVDAIHQILLTRKNGAH